MKHNSRVSLLALFFSLPFTLSACKPPPTDADLARDMPIAEATFASDPLPSPPTEGAVWAVSPQNPNRIIYGIAGEAALVALECKDRSSALPNLQITRLSPADEGAGAVLALVGNGHIGRIEIDAREIGGRVQWQGEKQAAAMQWEPLAGPRQVTVTVPGAGMVTLNPSTLPRELVEACRSGEEFVPSPPPLPEEMEEKDAAQKAPKDAQETPE